MDNNQVKYVKSIYAAFGGQDVPSDDEIALLLKDGTLPHEKYAVQGAIALVKGKGLLTADFTEREKAAKTGAYKTASKKVIDKLTELGYDLGKFSEDASFEEIMNVAINAMKPKAKADDDDENPKLKELQRIISKLQTSNEKATADLGAVTSEYSKYREQIEKETFKKAVFSMAKKHLDTIPMHETNKNDDFYQFLVEKASTGKDVKIAPNGSIDVYNGDTYIGSLSAELDAVAKQYVVKVNDPVKLPIDIKQSNGKAAYSEQLLEVLK